MTGSTSIETGAEPASLAVVIPVYNEGVGAAACVPAVLEVLKALPGRSRLIVVDDGSTDETAQLLEGQVKEHALLEVVHHAANLGYGAAVRTGAETARQLDLDWVLFMDSDLTNPPRDIARFTAFFGGPYDYVKASRYAPGGSMVGVPWRRRAMSILANRFARAAVGSPITDPTNGFRAVRTQAFLAMPLKERGFPIILEELYWAVRFGLRSADLPSTLASRSSALRASSFRYGRRILWTYARYTLLIAAERVFRRRRPRSFAAQGTD